MKMQSIWTCGLTGGIVCLIVAMWAGVGSSHVGRSDKSIPKLQSNAALVHQGADWPSLFGPLQNSCSPATRICWPATGPRVLWRNAIGEGYSSPVARGDDVVV